MSVEAFDYDAARPTDQGDAAQVLRRLVAIDAACFPSPQHQTLAALQHSAPLRRATKLLVAWLEPPPDAQIEVGESIGLGPGPGPGWSPGPGTGPGAEPVGFLAYTAGSMEFSVGPGRYCVYCFPRHLTHFEDSNPRFGC
jgi:hypothetical protein